MKVNALFLFFSSRIEELEQCHPSSPKEQQKIRDQLNTLSKKIFEIDIDKSTTIHTASVINCQQKNHLLNRIYDLFQKLQNSTNGSSSEKIYPLYPNDNVDGIDLCEIANLLYQNKIRQAWQTIDQKPPQFHQQLQSHCLATNAEYDPRNRERTNIQHLIQALLRFACSLHGKTNYPSSKAEIDEIFRTVLFMKE